MKKFLALLVFILAFVPCMLRADVCHADIMPTVTSDSRDYSIVNGTYTLDGNVKAEWAIRSNQIYIGGDYVQVRMYALEAVGEGNIFCRYGDISVKCDSVFACHEYQSAFLTGSVVFHKGNLEVSSDKATYCWDTKIADFQGNVKVNGVPKGDQVLYNVDDEKFVS